MITKEQVMPLLLHACPSFAARWKEHQAFYGEELLYDALGEFAAHLIDLYTQDEKQGFATVFNTIEALHLEGDEYVREAATIGLLEGIQNIAGNLGLDPGDFVVYLEPESKRRWDGLNDFWSGNTKRKEGR